MLIKKGLLFRRRPYQKGPSKGCQKGDVPFSVSGVEGGGSPLITKKILDI
jgi:hypothetical protein